MNTPKANFELSAHTRTKSENMHVATHTRIVCLHTRMAWPHTPLYAYGTPHTPPYAYGTPHTRIGATIAKKVQLDVFKVRK